MPLSSDEPRWLPNEGGRGMRGFFRVARGAGGAWWLIDPEGRPFFARAVNDVDDQGSGAVERLRRWGFNVLGAGAAEALRADGLPFVATVNFGAAARMIRASGVRLPDVFDLAWSEQAAQRAAEVCGPLSETPELLGWLFDEALGWGVPTEGRPSLLQVCLSLEPGFAAYHAAWEFVLAPHRGELGGLAKAWAFPMANRESVREHTRTEQVLATRGYLRDNARWTREFAQRYFAGAAAAVRAHDSNHLLLGARADIGPGTAEAGLGALAGAWVDVPWVGWREVGAMASGPVFAGDFAWTGDEFTAAPAGGRAGALTSVERMLRRGRAALQRLVAHPSAVGYAWARWRDRAGEQPPFGGGLVHGNDAEAREHTELVADIHRRLGSLRAQPAS